MRSKRLRSALVLIATMAAVVAWPATPAIAFTEGTSNNFFGTGAGDDPANTGSDNSFFGGDAGTSNTTGSFNAFFGTSAGFSNTGGADNSFFGRWAGLNNTTASSNSFFGSSAGVANTGGGADNSFFGQRAGLNNTFASRNSFFGSLAGLFNTVGADNSFFGQRAGRNNTTASSNSFFGTLAGFSNTTGEENAFFGRDAGSFNTTGSRNAFFGHTAGASNTTEGLNTFIGSLSNGVPGIINATAVGNQAQVSQSNSLVLGSIAGLNSAAQSVKVGIGAATPQFPLHVRRTDGTAELLVEEASGTTANRTLFELTNNGAPRFFFNDTSVGGVDWQFSKLSNHNFTISDLGDGGAEMILQPNGVFRIGDAGVFDLVLDAVGNLTIGGTLTESSDRNKKADITPADASKLLQALKQLDISTWRHKGDDMRHLGPMAQDFHRLVGVGTSTTISPRDLAALAVAAIQAQQNEIDELKRAVAQVSSPR